MSIASAIERLEALRCAEVAALHHYGIGAVVPDSITHPSVFLALTSSEDWSYQTEAFDTLAATLNVGVAMTLVIERYTGRGQPGGIQALPVWLGRLMTMLATDITLGDYLAMPMMGNVRKAGVLEGGRARYFGVVMDLRLLVRIQS